MRRKKLPIFVILLIFLASIGFFSRLVRNPGSFLMTIGLMIVISVIMFMIINRLVNRDGAANQNSAEMRKYRQAVKQSKLKHSQKSKQQGRVKPLESNKLKQQAVRRKVKRDASHLRVIEGKKSKDNSNNQNRASN